MSQVTIDSVAIGGTGGRTIHGAWDEAEQGGIRTYSIGVKVEGSTIAETEGRWLAAVAACSKRGVRVTATMDVAAGSVHFDRFPGDGITLTTECSLSKDRSRTSTGHAIWGVLTIRADGNLTAGDTPTAGGDAGTRPTFEGQVGEWRLVKTFNEAGVESRSLAITFTTLFDQNAAGPLAFSAVVSAGGFARFQFASLAGVSVAAATMMYVSGNANYNGPHEIASIDVDNFRITTRTVWVADGTGTALIGEQTSPEENYLAQVSELRALLGVASDGGRDSNTGLTESGMTHDETRSTLTVVLTAHWVQEGLHSGIRSLSISHEVTNVAEWSAEPEAGESPVLLTATVTFHAAGVMSGTNPRSLWASIRSGAISQIKSQAGYSSAQGPMEEVVRADKNAGQVIVTMSFRARNVQVLLFRKTTTRRTELLYQAWQAGLEHYIQTAGISHDRIVAATTVRIGVGEAELTVDTPEEPEWTYIDISDELGMEGRTKIREFAGGAEIYAQSLTRVFRRFKLREGVRARIPSTGSPPVAAPGPVTGPPAVTPPSSPPPPPVPPGPPAV